MFILQASEALTQHLQVFIHNLQEMQSNQHIYSLLVFQDSDVHRLYGTMAVEYLAEFSAAAAAAAASN